MQKILVIEDEENLRENLTEILENEGFGVATAINGKSGLKMIRQELPDLIICDVMMPEMDGFTLLKKLQSNPLTSAIPFIFLTAKFGMDDLRHGMRLGADDYLTKPFRIDDLLKSIQIRLQKSVLRASIKQTDSINSKKMLNINDKILISAGRKAHFAQLRDLKFIKAKNPYINLKFKNGMNYLIRETISEWEEKLPFKNFVRIHRSTIINTELIVKVEKLPKAALSIILDDEPGAFVVSKRYGTNFKSLFMK